MTEPSPPGWKCILPGPQPAWVCLGSVELSMSTGETTGPWALPLQWGQWGIGGRGAQTSPGTEGWGAPNTEVPAGRCPAMAAAEACAGDLKAKHPSPLIHLLFPPSHEAPTSLPPSCDLKTGLSFRRVSALLARPPRCTAFGVLPVLRSLCCIKVFSISPNSSVKDACGAANTKSRRGPSFS